jgi:thioredoxin-related protein
MSLKILYFYSNNCHFCRKFNDEWSNFKVMVSSISNIEIIELINSDSNNELYSKFNIRGVPTIVLLSNNINQHYTGNRTAKDLYAYISQLSI